MSATVSAILINTQDILCLAVGNVASVVETLNVVSNNTFKNLHSVKTRMITLKV
jgi:hypothetical protein